MNRSSPVFIDTKVRLTKRFNRIILRSAKFWNDLHDLYDIIKDFSRLIVVVPVTKWLNNWLSKRLQWYAFVGHVTWSTDWANLRNDLHL